MLLTGDWRFQIHKHYPTNRQQPSAVKTGGLPGEHHEDGKLTLAQPMTRFRGCNPVRHALRISKGTIT